MKEGETRKKKEGLWGWRRGDLELRGSIKKLVSTKFSTI